MLLLILIYLAFIMIGLPHSILGSAWPIMYEQFHVSSASAGIISMVISSGTIFSALYCDKVVKHLGPGKLTLVSMIAIATALFGFGMSTQFWLLCFWAIFLGVGLGLIDALLNNVVALHYQAKHMSWLHGFWGVGASIGPIIMSYFLVRNSWEAGYRFIGLIQVIFIAVLLLTLKSWKKVHTSSIDLKQEPSASLTMKQLMYLPGVKQSLIVFFSYCAIEATVGLWGASYLVVARGIAEETAALWISLYFLGITCGRFMAGFLTIKLSHKWMIGLGTSLIAVGVVIILLPVAGYSLLLALFLIGLGCAPIFPSLIHETPHNFGSTHSQSIVGLQMASAYIGAMFMPPLFGLIAAGINFRWFPIYISAFLILMAITTRLLYQKTAKQLSEAKSL